MLLRVFAAQVIVLLCSCGERRQTGDLGSQSPVHPGEVLCVFCLYLRGHAAECSKKIREMRIREILRGTAGQPSL